MPISIRGCREFIVLAERLNFSKAATALHLSQPALSKHVALMEREIGRALLTRGAPTELTAAGVKFREACVSIVEIYESAVADIQRLRSQPAYSLTVVGPLYIKEISSLVSRCAAAVRQDYELQAQLVAESPTPYLDILRSGMTDIAIASFPDEKVMDGIGSMNLYRWQLCIAVRENHRLARFSVSIPFSELDGETVRIEEGVTLSGLKRRFLDLAETHHVKLKLRARQCSIYDLHLEEVSGEILFTSEEIMQRFSYPGFVVKRIADNDCFFDMRACWSTRSENPAVPLFINQMHRLVSEERSEQQRMASDADGASDGLTDGASDQRLRMVHPERPFHEPLAPWTEG